MDIEPGDESTSKNLKLHYWCLFWLQSFLDWLVSRLPPFLHFFHLALHVFFQEFLAGPYFLQLGVRIFLVGSHFSLHFGQQAASFVPFPYSDGITILCSFQPNHFWHQLSYDMIWIGE
jgi:hypothetical protein